LRRRQYNEGVRFLVAFVKRRDQRWKLHVADRERLREERERQVCVRVCIWNRDRSTVVGWEDPERH